MKRNDNVQEFDIHGEDELMSTELISGYLDHVMAPLVRNLPSYIKDTKHALQIFQNIHFFCHTQTHLHHGSQIPVHCHSAS